MMTERWLLADVGGTTTRLGLAEEGHLVAKSCRSLPNRRFARFDALVRHYLEACAPGPVSAVCAGVAGPVRNGNAELTNHRWAIESAALARITGAGQVTLINDIQAHGFALDDLEAGDLQSLFDGAKPAQAAPRLVMGIGTGCNLAVVHRTGEGLLIPPAESGHASLPFAPGELGKMIDHLGSLHRHRPLESALSAAGLQNIWRWLGGGAESSEQIIMLAHQGDTRATHAVALFARLLGQVAGDMALAHLPMDGFFLFGGMARAIAPFLTCTLFHEAFIAKGPYESLLQAIPIRLISRDSAGLNGCARLLRQRAAA